MESVGQYIFILVYGLFWVGLGLLVRKYPETISGINSMPKEKRDKLNLPKIGRFVSVWIYVSAAVIFLSMLIRGDELRGQVLVCGPIFLIMLCWAYLIKYKSTRFSKEE